MKTTAKTMMILGICLGLTALPAGHSAANEVIIFGEAPLTECGESWNAVTDRMEFQLSVVPTTNDDFMGEGYCQFTAEPEGLLMQGARLQILDRWGGHEFPYLMAMQAEVVNHQGPGCTRLHYYDQQGELMLSKTSSNSGDPETLFFTSTELSDMAPDHPPGSLVISSCGGILRKVDMLYWIPNQEFSFSQVKGAYR